MLSYHILKESLSTLPLPHQARYFIGKIVLLSICLLPHMVYAMDDIDSARRTLRQIYYQLNQQQQTTTIYCGCAINYIIISKDKKFKDHPKDQSPQDPQNTKYIKDSKNTPAISDTTAILESPAPLDAHTISDNNNLQNIKDYKPLKFGKDDRIRWSFDSNTCGFTPRSDRRNRPHRPNQPHRIERRNRPNYDHANRVELAHIMPAKEFGHNLSCWQQGGRKQCREDKAFNKMEGDLHNLFPSIAAIKRDRLNFPFANWQGTPNQYGQCQMLIDFQDQRAQPSQEARGPIARAYLYIAQTYNIKLSAEQNKLYTEWHEQYPATAIECERNKLIAQKQGNENLFITTSCKLHPPLATPQNNAQSTNTAKQNNTSNAMTPKQSDSTHSLNNAPTPQNAPTKQ